MITQSALKVFFILCGIVGGWASALYAIGTFGSSPAAATGQWRSWDVGAGSSSNIYAVAHFLLAGEVPPAPSHFHFYSSTRDDEGNLLRSECVYQITANKLQARWWSLSVEPSDLADAKSSSVITSEQVVQAPSGNFAVAVSRHPTPGNWVRTAHDGNVELRFLVTNDNGSQAGPAFALPAIQRLEC